MSNQYRIKIVKETVLDLDSENEAKQVAELLSLREVKQDFLGHICMIRSDYELVS